MSPPVTPAELWQRVGSPRRAVAIVAHPDDESFGLGAVLSALVDAGTSIGVVCLTHGEASTLGAGVDLGARRDAELCAAAAVLGVDEVALFDHADGHVSDVGVETLVGLVDRHMSGADLLVAFEPGGVTGHADHQVATAVARRIAVERGVSLLEWGVSQDVAAALRDELGAPFVALDDDPGAEVLDVAVDRERQLAAIACHASQATDNPVLVRRLALQGPVERVRWRSSRVSAAPDRDRASTGHEGTPMTTRGNVPNALDSTARPPPQEGHRP
jgi:LmbE family N-acetylglucosaminyl deacetylase